MQMHIQIPSLSSLGKGALGLLGKLTKNDGSSQIPRSVPGQPGEIFDPVVTGAELVPVPVMTSLPAAVPPVAKVAEPSRANGTGQPRSVLRQRETDQRRALAAQTVAAKPTNPDFDEMLGSLLPEIRIVNRVVQPAQLLRRVFLKPQTARMFVEQLVDEIIESEADKRHGVVVGCGELEAVFATFLSEALEQHGIYAADKSSVTPLPIRKARQDDPEKFTFLFPNPEEILRGQQGQQKVILAVPVVTPDVWPQVWDLIEFIERNYGEAVNVSTIASVMQFGEKPLGKKANLRMVSLMSFKGRILKPV